MSKQCFQVIGNAKTQKTVEYKMVTFCKEAREMRKYASIYAFVQKETQEE